MTLTEQRLLKEAGETVFARGEDYTRYVRGLRVVGESANATIQAKNVYLVDLEWSAREITGWCTCPHHGDGNFCKHQVAVAASSTAGTSDLASQQVTRRWRKQSVT